MCTSVMTVLPDVSFNLAFFRLKKKLSRQADPQWSKRKEVRVKPRYQAGLAGVSLAPLSGELLITSMASITQVCRKAAPLIQLREIHDYMFSKGEPGLRDDVSIRQTSQRLTASQSKRSTGRPLQKG